MIAASRSREEIIDVVIKIRNWLLGTVGGVIIITVTITINVTVVAIIFRSEIPEFFIIIRLILILGRRNVLGR